MLKLTNMRLLLTLAAALALVAAAACGGAEDDDTDTGVAAVAPTAASQAAAPKADPTAVPQEAAKETTDESTATAMMETEFKGTFLWDGPHPTTFSEAPALAAMVAAGTIPPLEERLPDAADVLVVPVVERIGDYGGTWRRAFTGPNDGQNADRIMMDEDIKFDLNGTTIIPNLAKSFESSADGITFTLELRKGLKWSDGTPFTADNYVWWWENVVNNEEINPGRNKQLGWSGYNPETVKKIDDYTIQWVLPESGDGFIDQLATYRTGGFTLHGRIADGTYGPQHYMMQFHRDFVDDQAAYDKMVADEGFESWPLFFKERGNPLRNTEVPVVSPWKLTSPITEQIYEWERNPYYWAVDPAGNQLPYIDKISMVLTGDKEVLNLKAIAGEIDFQHRHIEMAKVPVIRENEDACNCVVKFWPSPHGAQAGLVMNLTYGLGDGIDYEPDPEIQKWMHNKDFRIAVSYAIDRNRVNEVVFLGLGTPMQTSFIKGHDYYPGDEWALKATEHDIDKANQMLDDLGLTEKDGDGMRLRTDGSGDTLDFEMGYIAEYFVDYEGIAEIIQEDLRKVGIKTHLKAEDVKLYADRRAANSHIMTTSGTGGQRYPMNLSEWFGIAPGVRNWYTGAEDAYAAGNPVYEPTDPAILRIRDLTDEAKKLRYSDRKDNYIETQRIFIDNMFAIGLIGGTPAFNGVVVHKKNFKNVPDIAPNQSALQNPGIGRTVQFFFEGGKNDSE